MKNLEQIKADLQPYFDASADMLESAAAHVSGLDGAAQERFFGEFLPTLHTYAAAKSVRFQDLKAFAKAIEREGDYKSQLRSNATVVVPVMIIALIVVAGFMALNLDRSTHGMPIVCAVVGAVMLGVSSQVRKDSANNFAGYAVEYNLKKILEFK